ncbi:DNA-3-methyladenine glycosylase I [soil metagenome]
MDTLVKGADGRHRCWWGSEPAIYRDYHDTEWGFPVLDDSRLFEKLCLEGFQAGLSWLTILRKRSAFRLAFSGFDPIEVATFDDSDVERLLADAGIVRHEGKIRSTVNNAGRALEMIESEGSLSAYFWAHARPSEFPPAAIPASTDLSHSIARDLKRRGWTFVGPTTVYAFMQAMGIVNDHVGECWVRANCELTRRKALSTRD